jgi:hypothetical protein
MDQWDFCWQQWTDEFEWRLCSKLQGTDEIGVKLDIQKFMIRVDLQEIFKPTRLINVGDV